jgi:lysophospholipase L1-like esterase
MQARFARGFLMLAILHTASSCILLGANFSKTDCVHLISRGILHKQEHCFDTLRKHIDANRQIDVVTFGGSVTLGGHVNWRSYGLLFTEWLRRRLPASEVVFHNLGMGATGPDYPSLCVADLFASRGIHQATLVFLEFSINLGMEGDLLRLARSCWNLKNSVVFYVDTFSQLPNPDIFASYLNFTREELPSIKDNALTHAVELLNVTTFSIGAAFSNGSTALRRTMGANIFADDHHHLSFEGHAVFAELIASFFERRVLPDVLAKTTHVCNLQRAPFVFQSSTCYSYYLPNATTPRILRSNGPWQVGDAYGHNKVGMRLDVNSSTVAALCEAFIEFEIETSHSCNRLAVGAMRNSVRDLNGIVEISVNGEVVGRYDGFADWPWNIQQILRYNVTVEAGKHVVRVRVLNETSSGGHNFALTTLSLFGE